jgi:hypothetical protein
VKCGRIEICRACEDQFEKAKRATDRVVNKEFEIAAWRREKRRTRTAVLSDFGTGAIEKAEDKGEREKEKKGAREAAVTGRRTD